MALVRLLIAALFLFYVQTAESCSCALPSGNIYQNAICSSQIAIRANITLHDIVSAQIPGQSLYLYDIITLYKNNTGAPLPTVISTPTQSPACGVGFKVGFQYLIFAQLSGPSNSTMETGLCDFTQPWDAIKPEEQAKLDDYANNCTSVA